MQVERYLEKIKCEKFIEVSLENLKQLQKNHLIEIPFENLDMHMKKPILFSLEDTYDRILNKSRGGYCVQLNSLFGWLLTRLGYHVSYLPCYIYNITTKRYSNLPIHIILMVKLDEKLYYVDVGTTRIIAEPIELRIDHVEKKTHGFYRFSLDGETYTLDRKGNNSNAEWIPQLKFILEPKELGFFKEMNDYVQTEEHPVLFHRSTVVIRFENGIRFLIGNRYTEILLGANCEETRKDEVLSDEQVRNYLKDKFNLEIDDSFVPVDTINSYFESLKK
ncbi:unnamed protein product [Brachionus calyciflorus]|uniref:arylamine N-acetyltransferase n=1 Tax=Brachionus calyciflorus TaxID=104777 RepID=A0A813MB07_9BILA|nr:unnamed protein product [Brachionus calyciflorus]